MTLSDDEEGRIRSYLLGELAQEDARQLDDRLLRDDSFAEQVGFVEDEIIEDYVRGDLSADEAERLEKYFFTTPRRRRSLEMVRGLRERAIVVVHAESSGEQEEHVSGVLTGPGVTSDALSPRRDTWWGSRWKAAAVVAFVLLAGAGVWYAVFRQSPEARGLAALDKAYRRQRPLEARVGGLTYAPFVAKRGTEPEEVDYRARDHSRSLLLDAAENNPTASTLSALGRFYLTQQEFDKAIDQFEKGLRLAPNSARLHSDMGVALMEVGNAEGPREQGAAMEYFARGLKHLNRALELDDSLLEARFNRALIYQHMMLPQQARAEWESYLQRDAGSPWADEARRHLKTLTEQGQQTSLKKEQMFEEFVAAYGAGDNALAWRVLGSSRAKTGNFIVERLLDEYLTLAGRGERADSAGRLRMLQYAGRVEEQAVGDLFTADIADFYARATEEQRAFAERGRAQARSAQEHYNRGELERAVSLYREAAALFVRAGNEGEAMFADGWAGYCFLRIPDTGRAGQVFERLSRTYEERNYRSLLAQSLHALSDIQTSLDEVSKALDYARRSLEVSEQVQDTANQIRCLQQFVSMHLKLGGYRESLRMGRDALRLAQGLPDDPKLIWPFYHELAFDFYHLGLAEAALEFEKEALRRAQESDWPLIISRSYTRLGLIYEKLGDLPAAISSGQRARQEGERVSGLSRVNILANASLRLGHLHRQEGDFGAAIAAYDEAIRHYETLSLHIYLYEAHKGKFLAHLKRGEDEAARAELTSALGLFEQYRLKILEERNRNSFFDAGQDIYDLATDFAYRRMSDPEKAFDFVEASHARSLLDIVSSPTQTTNDSGEPDIRHLFVAQPLPLTTLRRLLPDDVQVIQYSLLSDRLLIWVISRDSVEIREHPIAAADLDRKVGDYTRLILPAAGDAEAAASAARELYQILIGPVEPLLSDSKQLFIVPDKGLNRLPFAALIDSKSGEFFVEKYRFVISPSVNVFVKCSEWARERRQGGTERVLSVGDPSFDRHQFPDLRPLPSSRREAEQVGKLYAGELLVGEYAREDRVRAEMAEADVIHIASHFVVDEQSPMLSKLLLAHEQRQRPVGGGDLDGTLSAFEVHGMRFPNTRLVVLSACQTGVERSYRGEGAVGMARAFISAGVPLVVASLWPVDSNATGELMISFHRHRSQPKMSTAEALRRAQVEMIRSPDRRNQMPYSWAAFIAIGGNDTF